MRIRSIVVGTAALALLAGCGTGGGTAGTPTTASQPTSTSGGAPRIDNPLDVKAFTADPCKTVTAAQVEGFGLPGTSGRVSTTAAGEGCVWLGASTPAKMAPGVAFLHESANLGTILPNEDVTYKVFEPQPAIQGYPAYVALIADQRNDGGCDVLVGVSDERAMLVSFSSFAGSPKFADPCAAVTEFANLAVTTIKAGAK
ncbi:DUF3558 domain-containing protein [Lentzea cavernae]|uniref:DUF3558 domain-containing protein n=1 Tax=Lentzea cavernae TaxID=2020703 RepID=A0ABQ3MU54_9PSEU|nr:DUF3558 domain-containing protein [Lentzea cavernae]GHH62797.1 hypothetical protein GCM10017774_91160 [Lentzea cavernae]